MLNEKGEEIITPAEEEKKTELKPEEKPEEKKVEEPRAKTVEEILSEEKPEMVPLSNFLEIKKEKKQLEKTVKELQEKVANGATKSEVNSDLKAIADKYDVDPEFLNELSTVIYAKAKGDATKDVEDKLKPLEAKEKAERIEKVFSENFNKVMEEMPEYANVVNRDVIKELSLLPQNAKKTFQQIIEDTYGKTVTGKKTMEPSSPRGGKDAGLDKSRLSDPEYFKEVMANPELKKEYNKSIQDRIQL